MFFNNKRIDEFRRIHAKLTNFCHVDAKGNVTKAFMLPQKNPRRFYRERFLSFNVPDFVIAPTQFDGHKASGIINDESRTKFGVRK